MAATAPKISAIGLLPMLIWAAAPVDVGALMTDSLEVGVPVVLVVAAVSEPEPELDEPDLEAADAVLVEAALVMVKVDRVLSEAEAELAEADEADEAVEAADAVAATELVLPPVREIWPE